MNDIDREERIDRYLRGEMTPGEKAEMEKDMAHDRLLARDVETTRSIIERMRALDEKKRLMAQWEEEYQASKPQEGQERQESGRSRNRWMLPIITSLAACLVAGLFLWNNLSSPGPDEPVSRGGSALKYISTLIDDGKYDEAISLIDTALADTIIDPTLPAEVQEDMRKEKQEERETLIQLRQKAMENKAK